MLGNNMNLSVYVKLYTKDLNKQMKAAGKQAGTNMTTALRSSMQRVTQGFEAQMAGANTSIVILINNLNTAAKAAVKTESSMKRLGKSILKMGNGFMQAFKLIAKNIVFPAISKGIGILQEHISSSLRTNKQFSFSLNAIKSSLITAFQPVYQAVLPIINSLMAWLAKAAAYAAAFMSSLFGTTYEQSFAAAKGLQQAGKAVDGYGKAAKRAGQLAEFDQLNLIGQDEDTASGISSGWDMEMPDMDLTSIQVQAEGVAVRIKTVFDNIREAIQPSIDAVTRLGLALEPLKTFAVQGLSDFYNHLLVPLGTWVFGEGIPRFVDALSQGFSSVNWEAINTGLSNVWDALQPFAINVGEGLLWLWENVLVPLGAWVFGEGIPAFLNAVASAIDLLNPLIEAFKPLAQWLWDSFLQPLTEFTGGVIVSVLNDIATALDTIGKWMADNREIVMGFTLAVIGFFAAWKTMELLAFMQMAGGAIAAIEAITTAIKANILAKIVDKAETIYLTALYAKDFVVSIAKSTAAMAANTGRWIASTVALIANKVAMIAGAVAQAALTAATIAWNVAAGIGTAVATAFGVAVGILTSPIGLVVLAIAGLVAGIVLLVKNWDAVKETASEVWEGIKKVWGTVSDWFKQNVTDPIGRFFTGMINTVIDGINWMIQQLNKINVSIPDWVPVVGGKSVGFNLQQVPRLAEGGLITGPTLAMVGDNRNASVDPEVVTPLSKLEGMMGSGNGEMLEILLRIHSAIERLDRATVLMLNDTEIGRTMIDAINKVNRQSGYTLLEV